jgi:hypothetical protein
MSGQLKLKAASLGGDIALVPTDTAVSIVVTIPAVTSTLLNDQSNIEAQTKTALNATGSAPIYACRAWVNFDGTASPPTIRASGNVTSITDNGVGDYTVNFTTAIQDANYSTAFGGRRLSASTGLPCIATAKTTTTCQIRTYDFSTFADWDTVDMSVFR